ncbi:hypothetical protein LSAT2_009414 [Lamellibrachia satsuma]|nr:hypothetical protein LSAT2_009414 [Lamellibrachia satsuma]
MSLHTAYAVSMGFKKGTLRIEDTDVVLAVATVPKLDVEELWAAFGRDKDINSSVNVSRLFRLRPNAGQLEGLLCSNYSFSGIVGRTTACITACILERFPSLLFDRTSSVQDVNEERHKLFVKIRGMEEIPPNKDALANIFT